jgi:endonuclease/exonuclease/phosphatase family metal-dependent hydrolase
MRIRRAFSVMCIIAVAVFSICFAFASPAPAANRGLPVTVMTRNMDPGVDLMAAATMFDSTVLQTAFSIIPERARLIAVEIARTKPDLVALQEATRWRIESEAGTTVLDQLDLLMQYLRAYGQHYKKAVVHTLTDVQLEQIGYTDRDAILVRSDLPPDQLSVSRPETHFYQALMSFEVPFQEDPLTILRGWESVNVEVRGSRFKFVSTHLESPIPDPAYIDATKYLQELQASELMEDLEDVKLPIILAGDFNSDAEQTNNYPSDNTNSFKIIEGFDFNDAWNELRPNNPGFTWSLYPVEGINFAPFERIDLIFSNGPRAVSIKRTGLEAVDDFFASDHAGVVAVFDLMNHHPSHYGKIPMYRNHPMEYPGCHLAADRLRHLYWSGFRRH